MVRFMAGEVRIYHTDTFSGVILDQFGFKRAAQRKSFSLRIISLITC